MLCIVFCKGVIMKKRTVFLLFVFLIAAGGSAWAQLAFGITGSANGSTSASIDDFKDRFERGEGIFYGGFVELGMRNLCLGTSWGKSSYSVNFGGSSLTPMQDLMTYTYAQGHLFSYKAFLDPFFEVGFGKFKADYANSADDTDDNNPLKASRFLNAGGGVGLNFGHVGIFLKVLYAMPFGQPVRDSTNSYDLDEYSIEPLEVFIGTKIIL